MYKSNKLWNNSPQHQKCHQNHQLKNKYLDTPVVSLLPKKNNIINNSNSGRNFKKKRLSNKFYLLMVQLKIYTARRSKHCFDNLFNIYINIKKNQIWCLLSIPSAYLYQKKWGKISLPYIQEIRKNFPHFDIFWEPECCTLFTNHINYFSFSLI